MLHAVMLAGGRGERLWPWTQRNRPKQLLPLGGGRTLLEEAMARVRPLVPASRIWVITQPEHTRTFRRALQAYSGVHVVGEPAPRGTAAAIGLGAVLASHADPQAIVVCLPSDHLIRPRRTCVSAIRDAVATAKAHAALVTLGIPPQGVSTGYGHLCVAPRRVGRAYRVRRFVEKPSAVVAKRLLRSPHCYWNGGFVVARASVILDAISSALPRLGAGLATIAEALDRPAWRRTAQRVYRRLPTISFDHGVLEHARDLRTVVLRGEWFDVGSWDVLARMGHALKNGQAFLGLQSPGTLCLSEEPRHLVAAIGLPQVTIVHTPTTTLICDQRQAQRVRELVALLRRRPSLRRYL